MAYDPHPEDSELGRDFLKKRFHAKRGDERDEFETAIENEQAARAKRRRERKEKREKEANATARKKRIKREGWEKHGRVLSDAEAVQVAAENLDAGGTHEGESETEAAIRRGAAAHRSQFLPHDLADRAATERARSKNG